MEVHVSVCIKMNLICISKINWCFALLPFFTFSYFCIDINECGSQDLNNCLPENHVSCVNLEGSFECECVNSSFMQVEASRCIGKTNFDLLFQFLNDNNGTFILTVDQIYWSYVSVADYYFLTMQTKMNVLWVQQIVLLTLCAQTWYLGISANASLAMRWSGIYA